MVIVIVNHSYCNSIVIYDNNTYIVTYLHTYILTSIHPYIHASIHPCIHISMHPYTHASIHPYTHASIYPCIHASIHTYIHRHIYIYIIVSICVYYMYNIHAWNGVLSTATHNLHPATCWLHTLRCWGSSAPCSSPQRVLALKSLGPQRTQLDAAKTCTAMHSDSAHFSTAALHVEEYSVSAACLHVMFAANAPWGVMFEHVYEKLILSISPGRIIRTPLRATLKWPWTQCQLRHFLKIHFRISPFVFLNMWTFTCERVKHIDRSGSKESFLRVARYEAETWIRWKLGTPEM